MKDFSRWIFMCVSRLLLWLNLLLHWSHKKKFTCMGFHVCYQSTFLGETLTTLITWIIFLLCGFSCVLPDYFYGWISYCIDGMNDFSPLCGFSCVLPDYFLGWNSYYIDHINNFSLLCWFSCVLPEYFLGETLTTLITWMIFPSCVGFHAA